MQALFIIEAKGKVDAWSRVLKALDIPSRVLATHGHVRRFDDRLFPIGITMSAGRPCDPGRRETEAFRRDLSRALKELPAGAPVFIATDADSEGDVIALDVIEILLDLDAGRASRIHRVEPGALTHDGITAALEAATPLSGNARSMLERAIPGRARAISDRWIGATFSKMAGCAVGRVRTSLLGAFLLLEKAPDLLRRRPETGEIVFRCRSGSGGIPFVARVRCDGMIPEDRFRRMEDLTSRYKGQMVPGVIRARQSLSAGVAPRIGAVRPFNTGDALAYAARHFNLGGKQAMAGLQSAYMQGMTSYPRTDSRAISRESAARVIRIGDACRLNGLDLTSLTEGPAYLEDDDPRLAPGPHEALHPVCNLDAESIARFDRILRAPLRFGDHSGASPEAVMEIMTALVARRSFEAARPGELEPGDWRPDNSTSLSREDIEVLADLEWARETLPALPWSRDLMTGVRQWPLRAVAIDMMMSEGIGRPSTWASHADIAELSGEIDPGDMLRPPRPSPKGRQVLRKVPKGLWNPATCRMIEATLWNAGGVVAEGVDDPMDRRIRRRVLFWLDKLPGDMKDALTATLEEGGAGARSAGGVAPATAPSVAASPSEVTVPGEDLPAPTPFLS